MVFYGQKFWTYYSPVTAFFYAGDVDRPELLDTIRSLGALYVVRGNNDGYWAQNLRRSLNFTVGNVKFLWFMTGRCCLGVRGYPGGDFLDTVISILQRN